MCACFSMSVKLEVEKLCSLMDRQLVEETKKGGTNLLSDVLRKYTTVGAYSAYLSCIFMCGLFPVPHSFKSTAKAIFMHLLHPEMEENDSVI